jgi:hypothetical protein
MTTTTSYGTWANRVDESSVSVENSVAAMFAETGTSGYDLDAIVADYRNAINAALPAGVTLNGDMFYGPDYDPYTSPGSPGDLDIKEIVDSVDLTAIIDDHLVPEGARFTVYVVDGTRPEVAGIVDISDSPLENRVDVLQWAEEHGLSVDNPDVWLAVAPADVIVADLYPIAWRDFGVSGTEDLYPIVESPTTTTNYFPAVAPVADTSFRLESWHPPVGGGTNLDPGATHYRPGWWSGRRWHRFDSQQEAEAKARQYSRNGSWWRVIDPAGRPVSQWHNGRCGDRGARAARWHDAGVLTVRQLATELGVSEADVWTQVERLEKARLRANPVVIDEPTIVADAWEGGDVRDGAYVVDVSLTATAVDAIRHALLD